MKFLNSHFFFFFFFFFTFYLFIYFYLFINFFLYLFRVKGRNVEENQYIKMGAYHTVDLEANRKFTIFKEEWDSVTLDRIDSACDPAKVICCFLINFGTVKVDMDFMITHKPFFAFGF